jgi:ATP-dependent DNA helicase RecQ
VGTKLQTVGRNDHVELVTSDDETVARMSKLAKAKWITRLEEVREGRVVAMVRRYKKDIKDEEFQQSCQGDIWEVPIIELVTH